MRLRHIVVSVVSKMVSAVFRFVAIICTVVLVARSSAQPVQESIESLELSTLNADNIVVGKLTDYKGFADEQSRWQLTVAVDETIKGPKQARLELQSYSPEVDLRLRKARGSRLLVFSQAKQGFRPRIIDLDDPELCQPKADFTFIRNEADLIRFVKELVRNNPESKRFGRFTLRVPNDERAKAWKSVYWQGIMPALLVPADAKLEQWAIGQLGSKRREEVLLALSAMSNFKSDSNVRLLEKFLVSPVFVVERSAEYNKGVEVRRFRQREEAFRILTDWGVRASQPVLSESVSMVETLKELHLQAPVSREDLALLEACKELTKLSFSNAQLKNEDLALIGRLTNLTSLDINSARDVDYHGLKQLAGLTHLQSLNVSLTAFSDAGLEVVAKFKNLRDLSLYATEVTDSGIAEFIKKRPDVRVIPERLVSIISDYAFSGNVEGVRRVLDSNPKARDERQYQGNTPLHIAAQQGRLEVIRLLLDRGAPVDTLNDERQTAFQQAAIAYRSNISLLALMISRGADVNHSDSKGNTALHGAVASGSPDQIPFLLACGANPFAKNFEGKYPFDPEARYNKQSHALVADVANMLSKPLRMVKQTEANCAKVAYDLRTGSLSQLSARNLGALIGPMQWSKTPSGRDYLGPLGQQAVTLRLTNLPVHKNLQLSIDLFIIGSWDGNGSLGSGPDILGIVIPGVGTVLHSTFFNNADAEFAGVPLQSYPDAYPFGYHKGFCGAAEYRTLGFVEDWSGVTYRRDAVYKLNLTFAHSGSTVEIVLSGLTVPQPGVTKLDDDERWGIANMQVKTD